jgi:hypothetical protein
MFSGTLERTGQILHTDLIYGLGVGIQVNQQGDAPRLFGGKRRRYGIGHKAQFGNGLIHLLPGCLTDIGIMIQHLGYGGDSHPRPFCHFLDRRHEMPPCC